MHCMSVCGRDVDIPWMLVISAVPSGKRLHIPTPIEGEGGGDKTNLSNSTFFCLETLG